jgi:uncharacterized damage-inducible protein DinB
MNDLHELWVAAIKETVAGYRRVIDATIDQLSDEELFAAPTEGVNSVATNLRHLGGNLQSRWTDFLTSDGEKPSRDREQEFAPWEGDRESLLTYFNDGWSCLNRAVDDLTETNITAPIYIRGEQHTIPQAIARSITHVSYHVGQILIVSRMVHHGEWKWLTVAPGESQAFNQKTWGTAASRSTFGANRE